MSWARLTLALVGRAIVNPALAVALLRLVWRFRARRWFARPPFLPLPARDYLRWRLHTAYGDHHAVPPVEDVVRFAHWVARKP